MGFGGMLGSGSILLGLVVSVNGGILLEGAALAGARSLNDNPTTVLKVAKYSLAAIALVSALVTTLMTATGAGLSALIFVEWLSGVTLPALFGFIIGSTAAISTFPLHWKAFEWSGLVACTHLASLIDC